MDVRWTAGSRREAAGLAGFQLPRVRIAAARMPLSDVAGRRAHIVAERRLAETQPAHADSELKIPSRLIRPTETQPVSDMMRIAEQIPDPLNMMPALRSEREGNARPPLVPDETWEQGREAYFKEVLNWVSSIRRPVVVELALGEAIRRTLKNSHAIQAQSYNPAIDAARIVEAEAQFDAVFFTNFSYSEQDQPTGTVPKGIETDTRQYQSGIRKLLSTGMTVTVGYDITRSAATLTSQTYNPAYLNHFTVDFVQPLLRGFGTDFNRARIENARLQRDRDIETLRRNIRETLFNVEQAYWRLFQARRTVAINARR